MKVLVTGSNGLLGRMFIDFLKRKQIPYVSYDRAHPDHIPEDITAVVHFGGLTPHSPVRGKSATPSAYWEANVDGTKTLLDVLSERRLLNRFVHIGSASEYGFAKHVFKETEKSNPEDAYGKSKAAQSALIESFSRAYDIPTFNLRVFNMTGISRRSDFSGFVPARPHLFSFLMEEFRKGSPARILVNSENDVRDFISPEDLLQAIYYALTVKTRSVYELINISSGRGTRVAEVVRLFGNILGVPYTLKSRTRTARSSVGAPQKAKRMLGWKASASLEENIRQYVGNRKRIIIVGAGVAAGMVLDEIRRESRDDLTVVGFVDDDPKKQRKSIRGVPILGRLADLPRLVREKKIDQVLISTPSKGKEVVAQVEQLLPSGFPIKILPSVSSVILGKVDLTYIRDLDLSDLISRPLVKSNQRFIARHARNKTFLVTGGAGSIGSEIVRQLADSGAKEIVVFDSWEEGVFNILEEITASKGRSKVIGRIGNVRDKERLAEVFDEFRFDAVLHAAAYKHVPLMEENPREAEKTNVLGTKNVLEAVRLHGVKEFVLVSTDKAVHPSSVMGKSKRAAELLVKRFAKAYPKSRFAAVRFGNVLNSSGSAVPKFLRQIRARQPVTITHREMTRYFMSIPEAVSLVLTSWIIAKNGQILLLDMGEPVRILDLAERLIRIHGLKPYSDIPIVETGIRKGEKIHEELSYDPLRLKPAPARRIFIAEEL